MKTSKLKFVFAFVLLVAVAAFGANVQATTMSNSQMKLSVIMSSRMSNILDSRLTDIVDGDDPDSTVTVNKEVLVSNTGFYGVAGMNPMQTYALRSYNDYFKAYSLAPKYITEGAEFTDASTASKNIGIALAAADSYSYDELKNLDNIADAKKSRAAGVQAYVWVQSGSASASVLDSLDATARAEYNRIANLVSVSSLTPSYVGNTPIEMAWNEDNQRYEVTLTDTNGLDTTGFVRIALSSSNSSLHYSKNGNSVTFYTTDQIGSIDNPVNVRVEKSINGGWYGSSTVQTEDGSQLVYANGSYTGPEVYNVSLYTNALKVAVKKTLKGSATNSNTGDAKVMGAKYIVYSDSACTNEVAELVTDENGYAETKPLEVRNYYVKEASASEGCKVNGTVLTASVGNATTGSNGQKIVTVNSQEDVIYGGFQMVVSDSEDLSGSTTKTPSVGSIIELVLDSDPNQKYTAVVADNGYVEFTNIPYGKYTCNQTTRRQDGTFNDDLDLMDPISINITTEEKYQYSKIVNTEVAQRYVKILKTDSETGKLITNDSASFQVYNDKNQVVTQKVMYPQVKKLDTFTNADENQVYGWVELPEKLPYGTYTIRETKAPEGYYNASKATGKVAATFVVNANSTDNYDTKVVVESNIQNTPQKAVLTVTTKGNVLTGVNTVNGTNRPAYTTESIPGVKYELTATTDIVTGDGTVHMKKGETKTLTSDANGQAKIELYLGTYTIKMVEAPEGYVLDDTEKTINATYKGETIEKYNIDESYTLTRQEYDLDLKKEFSGINFYLRSFDVGLSSLDNEYEQLVSLDADAYRYVNVGIYAAEDITNALGNTIIKKDTLVDVVKIDKNGSGIFSSEYPMGKFYAKELSTSENYQLDESKHEFECKPSNNKDARFNVSVGTILNEAKKSSKLSVTKIETVDGLKHTVIPYSTTQLSISSKLETIMLSATKGALELDEDVDVTTLPNAKVQLFVVNGDEKFVPLFEKVDGKYVEIVRTTDQNGKFEITGLPNGLYAVKEIEAPRYYSLNDDMYYFPIDKNHQSVDLALEDDRIKTCAKFEVKDEDGTKIEGVKVQLVDADNSNITYEAETDKDGVAKFEGIRAGRYIRKVAGLAEQYVTPDTKEDYLEKALEEVPEEFTESIEVKFIKGNIVVYKTDDETGKPVAGCKFQVLDYNTGDVLEEAVTDENGYARFEGYRYGKYLVQEAEAAEDYEKSDEVKEVSIVEDGVDVVVDYTNVFTGDIAVALYAVIALVSVGAITMTVKKLRKN